MYFNQYANDSKFPTNILNDCMNERLCVNIDSMVQDTLQNNFTNHEKYKSKSATNSHIHQVNGCTKKTSTLREILTECTITRSLKS